MGELFVVGDQMAQVDIAEVLLDQDVLPDLITVDVYSIDPEGENEFPELGLEFGARLGGFVRVRSEDAQRIS